MPSGSLCAVGGCRSSKRRDKHLAFFHLPVDEARRKSWVDMIGRPDLAMPKTKPKSHFVCSLHFESSMINYKALLRQNALPTKMLSCQPVSSTSRRTRAEPKTKDVAIQTSIQLSAITANSAYTNSLSVHQSYNSKTVNTPMALSSCTSRKRKLGSELKEPKDKVRKLDIELDNIKQEVQSEESQSFEQFSFQTDDEVTKRFCRLIQWQSELKNNRKGNRYDPEFKLFALNLHFSSPQTYRSMKTFLGLPSESTLESFKMVVPLKFDDRTLEFLSAKLKSLPENAKYCTLCLDEMVLKRHLHYDTKRDDIIGLHNVNGEVTLEIASHACAIMLRSIAVDWKQPIAYSFLGSPKHYDKLEQWLDEVILKLSDIGIEIMAIVSDQGSNFDKYAKRIKKVTAEKPYFLLNNKKIYYIFDVPHLIKCLRNNLLTNNFVYDDKKVTWEHIHVLYSEQHKKKLKLIPKITEAHVKPNKNQKTRVKYAADIFSNSVYAALLILISNKTLPEEAKATAEFVHKMNNLFDILNSNTVQTNNKFQKAFSLKKYQLDVLEDAMTVFKKLKAIDSKKGVDNTKRLKTFKNIQITIQSTIMLCKDLKKEGFNSVFTRRLNQHCLENFFDAVREQVGNHRNPTAIEFMRAFSKYFLSNMLKNSRFANCEEDIYELLQKNEGYLKRQQPENRYRRNIPSVLTLHGDTEYRFDLPTNDALTYISGYLLYKCKKKHTCPGFDAQLQNKSNELMNRLFSNFKPFKETPFYGKLIVPTAEFQNYVKELETVFIHNFEKNMTQRPGSAVYEILKNICFYPPCSCFPHDYLLKLFIRFRIYTTIKFNNREFRKGKKCISN
uniref:THAP-type domain-containing protein n=1 Tax=Pectinophora gossypiella TaxID=13191 RepID=A0A1E1WCZ7_PECGO